MRLKPPWLKKRVTEGEILADVEADFYAQPRAPRRAVTRCSSFQRSSMQPQQLEGGAGTDQTFSSHPWFEPRCCACADDVAAQVQPQAVEITQGEDANVSRSYAVSTSLYIDIDEPVVVEEPQRLHLSEDFTSGGAAAPAASAAAAAGGVHHEGRKNSLSSRSDGSMQIDKRNSTGSLTQPKRRWKAANSSDSIMANVWERIASTGGPAIHNPTSTSHHISGTKAVASRSMSGRSAGGGYHGGVVAMRSSSTLVLVDDGTSCCFSTASMRMMIVWPLTIIVSAVCVGFIVLQEVVLAVGNDGGAGIAIGARIAAIAISLLAVLISVLLASNLGENISVPLLEIHEQMVNLGESAVNAIEMKQRRSKVKELHLLQDAFGRLLTSVGALCAYMPNKAVQGILAGDPRSMRLHVTRRKVSILFSDIVDFTRMSESLHQEDLLFILTWYLSTMTRIVEAHDGIVAEILGDGLLCFWNTPDELPDYTTKTLAAALAMQAVIRHMNLKLHEMDMPQLKLRIGIHVGNVLTGNLGSESKMKFGCLGDPVNVASRLEGLCKYYGVGCLCSGSVLRNLPVNTAFFFRRLDLVQLKGKASPISVYEMVGVVKELSSGSSQSVSTLMDHAQAAMTGTASALRSSGSAAPTPSHRRWADDGPARTITLDKIEIAESSRAMSDDSWRQRDRGLVSKEARERTEQYENALIQFQKANFQAAEAAVEQLLQENPDDTASAKLLQRIAKYTRSGSSGEQTPLSAEEASKWTGVLVMIDK
mmetsp:Transcript_52020/g.123859  ORF Transcript_52020/g.123859 Transcript_52020/m.123859 type:complete len:763 (+) Transcript_52020:11-2299(+)